METVSCIICRRRKIKCDRRPVTCVNCAKFGTPCSYVDTSAISASRSGVGRRASSSSVAASSTVPASATTTQAGLQRRRILRSCTGCKRAKAKCSGGTSCSRCFHRKVECVYDGVRRDVDAVSAGLASTNAEYMDAASAADAAGASEAYPVRPHPGFAAPQPPQPQPEPHHEPLPETHLGPAPAPHTPHAYPDRFAHQHTGYMPPPRLDPMTTPSAIKTEQLAMPVCTTSIPIPAFPLPSPPTAPPLQTHTHNTHTTQATASPPAVSAAPSVATAAVPAPPPVPPWLVASSLPSMERLRSLIDSYFSRIHPLRCLGFLHMPTFDDRLRDQQTLYYDSYGLVHAICALAAPFVYASETGGSIIPSGTADYCFYEAGHGWAATAMMRIFHHIGTPDVESLMTEMLLHEYYLRCGEYAKAFMLSGLVARHVQLLQLNLEHDCHLPHGTGEARGDDSGSGTADGVGLPWAIKESRRRLVWCCYLQDAFMECGIDQLRFVNPADIQVQLPCTEELFVRGKPCITEMLQPGKLLPFVAADTDAARAGGAANLDLRSFYIRAMAIRAKILKYVKHLKGDIPWSKDPRKSRFLCLDMELRALENSVPHDLRMNPENTSVFRWSGWSGPGGSGRLGLYFGVHILLAQTFNDLYRVGVENLVFPHHATQWIRTHAPLDFLVECHRMCSTKAVRIASLLEEVSQMDRLSLVDTPYAMHAQVCSSVMVMTMISWQSLCTRQREQLQQLQQARDGDKSVVVDKSSANLAGPPVDPQLVPVLPIHRRLLESNLATLDFLRCYIKADLYYESAKQALKRFEQLEAAARDSAAAAAAAAAGEPAPAPTDAPQYSLEYILNPLGVYPMARQQARNRHEPQTNPPPAASDPAPILPRPDTTSPLAGHPLDRSSVPVSTPEPPPVLMPNAPGQAIPVVDGSQTTGNEPGTHSMGTMASAASAASAANTTSPQSVVSMQQGVVPQAYYTQRTVPMYDTNMTGIATSVGGMAGMDGMGGMMGGGVVNMNNGVNNMNNGNSINDMDINMTMGGVSSVGGMPGMDTSDGGEPAAFNMWNWASEAPSMDSMGYPTFLEAFQ